MIERLLADVVDELGHGQQIAVAGHGSGTQRSL
jgi:hypothetical protein